MHMHMHNADHGQFETPNKTERYDREGDSRSGYMVCSFVCVYVCVCVYIHVYIHMCVYVCNISAFRSHGMILRARVCVCVCVCVCV